MMTPTAQAHSGQALWILFGFFLQMARTPVKLMKLPGSARTGTASFEPKKQWAPGSLSAVTCHL